MTITYDQTIDGLMHITARIARILVWSLVVITHLLLIIATLFVFWWLQISPQSIRLWLDTVSSSVIGQNANIVIGFFGISAAAMILAYAKACHWVISKWLSHYIFKGLGS